MKKIFVLLAISLIFILNSNAQSAATIVFNETNGNLPAVGTNFDVPVNVTGFSAGSMPGGISTILVFIVYDTAVLDYTGYDNSISGLLYTVLQQNDTMIRVDVIDWFGYFFNVPDGKLVDLQFDYLGGYSPLVFNDATPYQSEYGDSNLETFPIPTLTDGAVEGNFIENTISGGNWHTASDWTLNVVPNAWHNVTVSSGTSATASTDAICNKLKVEAGGTLILSDTLIVNND